MKIPVIMDCDPGWDDAIAIILALSSDKLDVKAVTTVMGNVPVKNTTENAKKILTFMKSDALLASGAEKPLAKDYKTLEEIHGKDGLFGLLDNSNYKVDERKAHDLIKDILIDNEEKMTIIATGALTNIALLIKEYPDVINKIDKICLMGGGIEYGNITKFAEYNFYTDPDAAKIVFDSNIPIIMCGLDVSYKAICTEEDVNEIKKIETEKANFVSQILEKRLGVKTDLYKGVGCPLYDPTAVAYLISPDLFKTITCNIEIATEGENCGQSTIADSNNHANVIVAMDVNRKGMMKLLTESLNYKELKFEEYIR